MPDLADPQIFRSILENLSMAVYVVARDGKILFWNDGAERITGYLRQDVIGRIYEENFLGELDGVESEQGGVRCPIFVASLDGKHVQTQVSLRHKSGHRVPVQLWAFPVRNSQGVIVGGAKTFQEDVAVADGNRRQTKLASYGVHRRGQRSPEPRINPCAYSGAARDVRGTSCAVFHSVHGDRQSGKNPVARWASRDCVRSQSDWADIGKQSTTNGFSGPLARTSVPCGADRVQRIGSCFRGGAPETNGCRVEDRVVGRPAAGDVIGGGTVVSLGDTEESMVLRAESALKQSADRGGNRVAINNR